MKHFQNSVLFFLNIKLASFFFILLRKIAMTADLPLLFSVYFEINRELFKTHVIVVSALKHSPSKRKSLSRPLGRHEELNEHDSKFEPVHPYMSSSSNIHIVIRINKNITLLHERGFAICP